MKEQAQEVAREKLMKFWKKQTGNNKRFLFFGVFLLILVLPLLLFWLIYRNSVYPGLKIVDTSVGGIRYTDLAHQLSVKTRDFVKYEKFVLTHNDSASDSGVLMWETDLDALGVSYDPLQTTEDVYKIGRGSVLSENLVDIWLGLRSEKTVLNRYSYSRESFESLISEIAVDVDDPGAAANIEVADGVGGGFEINIYLGENGVVIDREKLLMLFEKKLSRLEYGPIELPLIIQSNTVSERLAEQAKMRAEALLKRELVISLDDDGFEKSWKLSGDDLVAFIEIEGGFSVEKISEYVGELKVGVDRPAQNALFKFEGGRVTEFAPSLSGLVVDEEESVENIRKKLVDLEGGLTTSTASLVVSVSEPEIRTLDVNNLGINELIGKGESTYLHSIPGRVFNVEHTAKKLNGVLIPPGEEFSFNRTIGDISAATGFKSAYVIKDGRTVLGDGGGVCQDSTTLFRAVMDAGLPITDRKGHSYRVGYYEQNSEPGFDATVFSPSVDFKFKNDTPGHVLIQARADSVNYSLVIELYGTSDGRVSEISNYQKWGAVPAPPPSYQDDPSLAPGVIRQVDWAATGLKTKFDYKVTKGGETLFEKTFYTTYQPWRAVYLRGI